MGARTKGCGWRVRVEEVWDWATAVPLHALQGMCLELPFLPGSL
jgi:hypothetical protein